MKLARHLAVAIVILSGAEIASFPADAETKLTDFNGIWQGSGKDRNSPFEPLQQTSCHATINADLRRMDSRIACNGDAGLSKIIQLTITLDGDAFSGNLTQRTAMDGDNTSVSVLNGSVSGHKTDDTAQFQVRFPGLVPNVAVTLKLNSPFSYSMQAMTLGIVLMDVTFTEATKR
jgi:hypothetical protein